MTPMALLRPRAAVKALLPAAAVVMLAVFVLLLDADGAFAHAFGKPHELTLPLAAYLAGAGAAVALSFMVMALFLRNLADGGDYPTLDLLAWRAGRAVAHPFVLGALRVAAVVLFVVIIAAGFGGTQSPTRNIAPTLVWVIWWVGMAYVSALLGNLWTLINPWSILFSWADNFFRRIRPGKGLSFDLPYPPWLGVWPAVLLFLVFAWLEMVSKSGEAPAQLATVIVVYSAITWAGMAAFGREVWLRHGEAFTVVFSLFARFAPTEATRSADPGQPPRLWLRPPAVGLLTDRPVSPSLIGLVLLMLATVTLDGFIETPAWVAILDWIAANQALRGPLLWLLDIGVPDLMAVIKTVALVLFPLMFAIAFLVFSRLMGAAGGGHVPASRIAGFFVLTLIPIAIAYHLAHYLSFLLLAGQLVIPQASDPFGLGWDLFGTAAYAMDVAIINATFVWYLALTTIVAGHVVAVYVAHVMAFRVFADGRQALRSQVPMLVLMVVYTMLSLWILSQPVVKVSAAGFFG